MSKYELIESDQPGMFRVRALKDVGLRVRAGEVGGYVQHEWNLSQEGDCWVSDDAEVCDNARVDDDAWISDNAEISHDAKVSGRAHVYGDAWVHEDALVYGDADVSGNARVYGNAHICGNARVYGDAEVWEVVAVYGNAHIYGKARVFGDAEVYGDARVYGSALVFGNAHICGEIDHSAGIAFATKQNNWSIIEVDNTDDTTTLFVNQPDMYILEALKWRGFPGDGTRTHWIATDAFLTPDEWTEEFFGRPEGPRHRQVQRRLPSSESE